jgi:rRNA maturation endonuclease Nob1
MNYKCPNCNGEFNEWDTNEKDVCPFCGMERNKYNTFKWVWPTYTSPDGSYKLTTNQLCPICGADIGKGEQCCLTIHCCEEDRKHGGSGVAHVSCPCPRCTPRC